MQATSFREMRAGWLLGLALLLVLSFAQDDDGTLAPLQQQFCRHPMNFVFVTPSFETNPESGISPFTDSLFDHSEFVDEVMVRFADSM